MPRLLSQQINGVAPPPLSEFRLDYLWEEA